MNDVDMRDEPLGDLLDRAVRDVEPRSEGPAPWAREPRGTRGIQVAAAVLTAAIFVGVVAWAATQAERDPTRPGATATTGGDPRTYTSPDVPWVFEYAGDWNATSTVTFDPMALATVLRTTVTNGPLPTSAGDIGPHTPDDQGFTDELGDTGAVVLIQRYWSTSVGATGPEEPLALGPFIDEAQPPGWTFREQARCEGTLCFYIVEWYGPAVSDDDRAAAEAIARSVRRADVETWVEADDVSTRLHDERDLLTVTHPNDWVVADENLTPWLSSPTETLSLGTFPLTVSTDPDDELRIFGPPVAPLALADMTAEDAFVSVQEEGSSHEGDWPRPETFRSDDCTDAILGCDRSTYVFQAWWTIFEDHGRGFYLFVAIGNDASPELVEQTWAVADSLRFYPSVG